MKKNRIKRIFILTFLVVLAGWAILFFVKDWILGFAIRNTQVKLKNKYKIELSIQKYALHGWTEVEMNGVKCISNTKDTVASLNHIKLTIKLWPLITGKIRLENMRMENGLLNIDEILKLRQKKSVTDIKDSGKLEKARKYIHIIQDAARIVPDDFVARGISIRYADSSGDIKGRIDSVSYSDSRLFIKTELVMKDQDQIWIADGSFDRISLETHLKVKSNVTGFYKFSMIRKLASANIGFRSYAIDLFKLEDNGDSVNITGSFRARNIKIYNPKISADTVLADSGGIDFSINMTNEKIILDSTSRLHLNGLSTMIGFEYTYRYPAIIHAKLVLQPVSAQSILDAMPTGAFEISHSMTLDGNMGYHLDFYLDIDKKDSCRIDAGVINKGIKIINYGSADLRKINGNFIYHPYNSRRPILVDSSNPDYTSLSSMPKYLTDAVVSSEDPNFYYNNGIEPDAIEVSVLQDLKQGRFRQGGSTITMQLIKNVFLTHQKTIDRKLEEFFLVWLLENTHISNKNRILEVYMNIIEWGPDVYGIGEASRFYFNKKPSKLSLNESIFLAKIIPQPLGFMNRFDDQGNLKESFQIKALNTVDRMARRGKLDVDEQGSYWPEVKITGPAKNLIKINPSVSDSLRIRDSISRENDW